MPFQPLETDLHIDQLTTQVLVGYKNPRYIVDDICPIVPVTKRSNIIPKYNQSFWFRDDAAIRALGTKSIGGGFTVDNTSKYFCDRYSFRFEIADETRDNTDAPYDLDRDAAFFVADKLTMRRERNFATNLFTTSVWGADKTGGTDFVQWSNYGGSSPLVDITNFVDSVEGLVGVEPNTMVMGKQVWVQFKFHPDLIDNLKYGPTLGYQGKITPDILASLVDMGKILVGRSIVTTSAEGTAETSVTYSRIWGKNVLLLWVPSSPALLAPAACYTFVWQRVPNAVQYMVRYRDQERELDVIEGNSYFAQNVIVKNAGVFLSGAVA